MGDLTTTRRVVAFLIWLFAALAVLLISAIVMTASFDRQGVSAVGFGIAILLASLAIGSLLGFLFSVPRVLARGDAVAQAAAAPAGGVGQRLLQTNSNLERISDWLTTLLVGAGLTQLGEVGPALGRFRDFVAANAGAAGVLPGLAPVILVAGVTLGFLAMYLYTRIEITPVLHGVEGGLEGALDRETQRVVAGVAQATTKQIADPSQPAASDAVPPPTVTPGSISVDDALDVMFDLLYRPDGYRRVITLGEQLAGSPAVERADYWFYLAAAYGQQHAASVNDPAAAARARDKALDAGRRAVKIDPGYRLRLSSIASPGGPDDDLASLRGDAEFDKLVG